MSELVIGVDMPTRTYVAKKVHDQYLVVPKSPAATRNGACCLFAGAALMFLAAIRRGAFGWAGSIVGAGMLYWAATGTSPLCALLGPRQRIGGPNADPAESPTFQNDIVPSTQAPADEVDEAVMQSFPASDPPASTATSGL